MTLLAIENGVYRVEFPVFISGDHKSNFAFQLHNDAGYAADVYYRDISSA